MVRIAANIAVSDVKDSSRWYQDLLNCRSAMDPSSEHRELFDLLADSDGQALLILSKWDHSPLEALHRQQGATPGYGVVLFFSVADFEQSWERAGSAKADIVDPPHPSRGFEIPEFTVLDPNGYTVTVSKEDRP